MTGNLDYTKYDADFILDTQAHVKNAECLIPIIDNLIHPKSVVDVGCGSGAWLSVFKNKYNCNILGIDGEYVNINNTLLSDNEFLPHNLEKKIDIIQINHDKFDLAISLEVAEHLSPSRAEGFVEDLTKLSDAILFSAAIPLQGGVNHINERPITYWVDLFQKKGFVPINCIRPKYKLAYTEHEFKEHGDPGIAYANNAVLYINHEKLSEYDIVPSDYPDDDYSTIPAMQRYITIKLLASEYCLIPRTRLIGKIAKIFNHLFR